MNRMQKISPIRSSIEAFNKFKELRKNSKTEKTNQNQTNPFGITFKGTVIQMDVFEKTNEENKKDVLNTINEKLQSTGKLLASAWVGTMNKFQGLKTNVISFGRKIKENTINTAKKVYDYAKAPIDFNIFRYNVAYLQTQPVDELEAMLTHELEGVK